MTASGHFLLDCDPGIDDAFAIFCALEFGNLDVVTTVSGNVSLDNTTRNALYVLELAGADVAVHRGADRPLRVEPAYADEIHGSSGLGRHRTPEPAQTEQSTAAVDAILDYCADGEAVIVATGPLTNIAAALIADPTLAERVEHLYWMGGGTTKGNVTELAEFNAWCDPDAAALTLESGIPLTMFDLDLTHQVRMGAAEITRLKESGTAAGDFFADALDFYQQSSPLGNQGQPMHDPCAVLGFLRSDNFRFRRSNIVCQTAEDERGRTVVDFSDDGGHRLAVVADERELIELILKAITNPDGSNK